MSEERKVTIIDENGINDNEVQKLLEENDVNVDGESNVAAVQCIFGC